MLEDHRHLWGTGVGAVHRFSFLVWSAFLPSSFLLLLFEFGLSMWPHRKLVGRTFGLFFPLPWVSTVLVLVCGSSKLLVEVELVVVRWPHDFLCPTESLDRVSRGQKPLHHKMASNPKNVRRIKIENKNQWTASEGLTRRLRMIFLVVQGAVSTE